MVEIIRPEQVDAVWSDIEQYFIKANDRHKVSLGRVTPEEILRRAKESDILILKIQDKGAAAFEIIEETFHCISLGGTNMTDWIEEFVPDCELIAKELGMKEITLAGRKGWGKVLSKFNYEHSMTVYGRKL